jgi:hypothetical protein
MDIDKYNENLVISSDIFSSAIVLFFLDFITDPNLKPVISQKKESLIYTTLSVGFSYVLIQGLVEISEIF